MGCVSSKIFTRSRSFQEELSLGLQRRTNGLPVLEDLLISKNGGDQFLALVCAANTVTKKLQTGIPEPESAIDQHASVEPMNSETINTWELMAGLDEEQQEHKSREEGRNTVVISSRSFRQPHEYEFTTEAERSVQFENFNVFREKGPIHGNGGIPRSRSFHTVEEYDALVARNEFSKAREVYFEDLTRNAEAQLQARLSSSGESPSHSRRICNVEKKDTELKDTIKDKSITGEGHNLELKKTDVFVKSRSLSSTESDSVVEDVARKGNFQRDKGLQRKVLVKELSLLDIPRTIDSQATGSLREWFEVGGEVSSPESYVTPKFGSFVLPVYKNGSNGGEHAIFDPEMVATFEEDMEQLTAEEEFILKQIVGSLDEGVKEMEQVEEVPSHNIQG